MLNTRYKWLSLKHGFGRCGHGLGGCNGLGGFAGFSGFDGFSGFNRFSFVYSATKGFISCAELPSTYTWLKGRPQPCSMYK